MDTSAAQEIMKKPHTFDSLTGTYKELTKEPDPFYPKCKYAAPLGPEPYRAVVVNDVEEEKALGSGWYDHHDQIPKPRVGGMSAGNKEIQSAPGFYSATQESVPADYADYLKWKSTVQSELKPEAPKRRGRRPKVVEPTPEPE